MQLSTNCHSAWVSRTVLIPRSNRTPQLRSRSQIKSHLQCFSQLRPRHCSSLGTKTQLRYLTNISRPQQIMLPDRSLLQISSRATISFCCPAQFAHSDQLEHSAQLTISSTVRITQLTMLYSVYNDCGRLRQSGPRPDARLLRHPALEGLTRSARTDSPRQDWPETIFRRREAAHGGGGGGL
ncbi:hypothetical protein F511_05327 [Dorcoceras hygrometricum]|uniref:Uncharacterized protein n=1 Tax=Dorcoceras hygrometricum TaxID=472368 RepID=A0A2Z7ALL6_9LAMI|nr:hypothetical protein F511_05327 [Dorcoceras hygrometricum]